MSHLCQGTGALDEDAGEVRLGFELRVKEEQGDELAWITA